MPSGSEDADPSKETVWPTVGVHGVHVNEAVGGTSGDPVVPDGLFEARDQFGTSSEAWSANQYVVAPASPVIVASSVVPGACGKKSSSKCVAIQKFDCVIAPAVE